MSMVYLPGGMFWPLAPQAINQNVNFGGLTIDAADERAACVFQAPKAGDINTIKFRVSTVTTGATVTVGLYSVNTSGDPDIAGGALGTTTLVVASTDDDRWLSVTLGTAVTVTQGQILSCVVSQPSSSPGNMGVTCTSSNVTAPNQAFPYGDHFASAAWSKQTSQRPLMLIGYTSSGGLYPCFLHGNVPGNTTNGITNVSVSTSTSTKEAGSLVVLPFRCVVRGAWIHNANAAASDYYIRLYSTPTGSPVELAATPLVDGNLSPNVNGDIRYLQFTSSPTLEAGTKYALVYSPNTTTSSPLNIYDAELTADFEHTSGGNFVYGCFRNSLGTTSFTEETDRRYMLGLWIEQIDAGNGPGAAGLHIGGIC